MAEKTLYEQLSKPLPQEKNGKESKKSEEFEIELCSISDEQQEVAKHMKLYLMDEDEIEDLAFLRKRHTELDASRPDENWEIYWKQFESQVIFLNDGRANVNMPIEKATIRNKLADEESTKAMVTFVPTEENDIYKIDITRNVWNFVWGEANTDMEISKHRLQSKIFGTSIWYETLNKEIETKYQPRILENGEVVGDAKIVQKSWLGGKMLDIRNCWIDNVASIAEANDCFIAQRDVSFDEIRALKLDPNYNADAIDRLLATSALRKRGERANANATFTTDEEIIDSTEGKFNLMHYYSKSKGMYVVCDDAFTVIIRSGVNPYPHGGLPISVLVDHEKPYSIYGYGECELLQSTKYERNEIRNQILDGVRIGNTMNLLVGSGVAFKDNELVGGMMNVWNVEGDQNQARFLQSPQINSGLFNVDQMLSTDATWITGVDNNSLAGSPSKTAFEARLQEQNKLKGISMSLRQFDYWLQDMARQRLANIQFFLPTTTGRKILGDKYADKFRTIAFQDMEGEDLNTVGIGGKIVKKGVKLNKRSGKTFFFELTPDEIMSNLDVQVRTPTTTPILKDVQRAELKEFVGTLLVNYQVPEVQAVLKQIDWDKVVKEIFKESGFDPSEYFVKTEAPDEGKNAIKNILSGLPLPAKSMFQNKPDKEEMQARGIMQPQQQPGQVPAPAVQ